MAAFHTAVHISMKRIRKSLTGRSVYMELSELENRFIDELSGGQRQRAYIAMVIAQDTDYILLDEPTNNLDIYHADQYDENCPPVM